VGDVTIRIEGLGKRYALENGSGTSVRLLRRRPTRELWALRDVNLEVARGEIVGIVGSNGAGKSTLLKILSRITAPTQGRIVLEGRVGSLLEVGTGFHPELSGRENVFLNGALLGMRRYEIAARFGEIVDFAQVHEFLDTPVKHYSSGMRMRLAFAVAAHLSSEILIIDEVLAVGDAAFQRRCLGKMDEVARSGRTVLFVSHNLSAVLSLCTRAVWLRDGRVAADGATSDVTAQYVDSQSSGDVGSPQRVVAPDERRDAQILAARVMDASGRQELEHSVDEPIRVELEFEVRRDFESLVACCQLRSLGGEALLISYETDAAVFRGDVDSPEQPRRCGRYRAVFQIPAPLLNEGDYQLTLLLFEPRKQIADELAPFRLRLRDEGSFTSRLLQHRRRGVLALPLEWEVAACGS
jgi:lipopolysaccharide transport system ATP-binding protein